MKPLNRLNTKSKAPSDQNLPMNNPLHDLFLDELADTRHAETQLTKALPKMIKAAESDELRSALESHLEETKGHIRRIDEAFAALNEKVKNIPCEAMKGILEEGDELVKETKGTTALDAAIISAGQKVEHYEIASYGTLVAWATKMGHEEVASLLEDNLNEEKAADEKLTQIAETTANFHAEQE